MYTVYILKTSRNTFYTGIAKDVQKRLNQHIHKSPQSSKYLRSVSSVTLVYTEQAVDRGAALRREAEIKKLSHAKKELLIGGR